MPRAVSLGFPYPGNPVPESYSYALTRVNAAFPAGPNPGYYVRSFHPNEQIGPVGEVLTVKAGRNPNTPQYGIWRLEDGSSQPVFANRSWR